MSPRPILKRAGSNSDHPNRHAVHFPPSPSLTRTFFAHSSTAYDRSPIVVAPNSLALPERGCPGRTYTLDDPASPPPSPSNYGRSFTGIDIHSRAYAFASSRPERETGHSTSGDTLPPPLVPDNSSSESDESDGFIYPPQSDYSPESYHVHGLAIPAPKREKGPNHAQLDMSSQAALSFLPYFSSSPINNSFYIACEDALSDTRRRKKPTRERKHESSQDLGRIPSGEGQSPPRRSKKRATSSSFSLCSSISSLNLDDGGCLGGF